MNITEWLTLLTKRGESLRCRYLLIDLICRCFVRKNDYIYHHLTRLKLRTVSAGNTKRAGHSVRIVNDCVTITGHGQASTQCLCKSTSNHRLLLSITTCSKN